MDKITYFSMARNGLLMHMMQGKGRHKGLKRDVESIRGGRGVQDEPVETIRETGRYEWYQLARMVLHKSALSTSIMLFIFYRCGDNKGLNIKGSNKGVEGEKYVEQ